MSNEDKINREIEKTLALLDESKPLKADPYFYTRLKARMEREEQHTSWSTQWGFGWKVLAPALGVIIVAANIYTASIFLNIHGNGDADREELINLFATELTLDSSQYNPNLALTK